MYSVEEDTRPNDNVSGLYRVRFVNGALDLENVASIEDGQYVKVHVTKDIAYVTWMAREAIKLRQRDHITLKAQNAPCFAGSWEKEGAEGERK